MFSSELSHQHPAGSMKTDTAFLPPRSHRGTFNMEHVWNPQTHDSLLQTISCFCPKSKILGKMIALPNQNKVLEPEQLTAVKAAD